MVDTKKFVIGLILSGGIFIVPGVVFAALTVGSTSVTSDGNLILNGAAGSDLLLGSAVVGGALTIGGSTQTGILTLGQSTSTNAINIGSANLSGTSAQTVNIGNGVQGASTTTSINIANNTLGSGDTTINLSNAATLAGTRTVNIVATQGVPATDVVNIGHATSTTNLGGTVKLTTMTSGSVLFAGTGGTITQDNASLYFNNSTNKLGIGNTSPAYTLSVHASSESAMSFTNTSSGVTSTDGLYVGIDSYKIAYIWNYETGGAAGPISFGTAGAQTMLLNTTGDLMITGDTFKISTSASPASGAACEAGQMSWDTNYIYVCTASGAWKRAALTGGY